MKCCSGSGIHDLISVVVRVHLGCSAAPKVLRNFGVSHAALCCSHGDLRTSTHLSPEAAEAYIPNTPGSPAPQVRPSCRVVVSQSVVPVVMSVTINLERQRQA